MLPPAAVFPIVGLSAPKQLTLGPCILRGWSFRAEPSGDGANVDFFDGTTDQGVLVGTVELASAGSQSLWCGDSGVIIRTGLYADIAGVEMNGAVYYTPITLAEHRTWAFGEWSIQHVRA